MQIAGLHDEIQTLLPRQFNCSASPARHQLYLSERCRSWTMRKTFVGTMLGVALLFGNAPQAKAGALLNISTGAFSATCNNTMAITATNCSAAAGFTTVLNGNNITFTGPITGYSVGSIGVTGLQPGNTIAGNVLDVKFAVSHISGVDDLTVDFGGNDFSLPPGPGLFLSASDSGSF